MEKDVFIIRQLCAQLDFPGGLGSGKGDKLSGRKGGMEVRREELLLKQHNDFLKKQFSKCGYLTV